VPAEELEEFNQHIVGGINVIEAYPGAGFSGTIDPTTNLPLNLLQ
jgi:hypothetical protein